MACGGRDLGRRGWGQARAAEDDGGSDLLADGARLGAGLLREESGKVRPELQRGREGRRLQG